MTTAPLLRTDAIRRYRRACDYAAAAMIYLRDNALLREPLRREHLKPRLLGHWGTCPGITYLYSGLNGLAARRRQRMLLVTGPGHGAPAVHANLWLEGTHGLLDPSLARDELGFTELVRRFSWPGGFPSHLSPEVPGVIHEGGELGYALATAFGAALDNPGLLVACLIGDGEAETGPTAGSWHGGKFLDPRSDGAVLPIMHLNGYKIASPTVFGAMADAELDAYFRGAGWVPRILNVTEAADPDAALAEVLAAAHDDIASVRRHWRPGSRALWPMLVVRSPKGWGVPTLDTNGLPLEGTFHAHQVPLDKVHSDDAEFVLLERWLRSYRAHELFDADGRPYEDILSLLPPADLRLGRTPSANGGRMRRSCRCPTSPRSPSTCQARVGRTRVPPRPPRNGWPS